MNLPQFGRHSRSHESAVAPPLHFRHESAIVVTRLFVRVAVLKLVFRVPYAFSLIIQSFESFWSRPSRLRLARRVIRTLALVRTQRLPARSDSAPHQGPLIAAIHARRRLYDAETFQVSSLLVPAALLGLSSLIAGARPAAQASRVDPMIALSAE